MGFMDNVIGSFNDEAGKINTEQANIALCRSS